MAEKKTAEIFLKNEKKPSKKDPTKKMESNHEHFCVKSNYFFIGEKYFLPNPSRKNAKDPRTYTIRKIWRETITKKQIFNQKCQKFCSSRFCDRKT